MSDPPGAAPPFRCPDELRALLEETFRAAGVRDHVPDYQQLDMAIDLFARDARERGIPPERLLVAMIECMKTSQATVGASAAQRALRQHTITRALDAYYGSMEMGPVW